jgi:hypothetical protein
MRSGNRIILNISIYKNLNAEAALTHIKSEWLDWDSGIGVFTILLKLIQCTCLRIGGQYHPLSQNHVQCTAMYGRLLLLGNTFQDPQWMPTIMDSIEPYIIFHSYY